MIKFLLLLLLFIFGVRFIFFSTKKRWTKYDEEGKEVEAEETVEESTQDKGETND